MGSPPLAQASERLRDKPGFPKRPGRPRVHPEHGHVPVTSPSRTRMDSGPEPRPLVPQASVPVVLPRLLGVREAGAYLGISPFTIRNMVRDGRLPVVHVPGLTRVLLDIKDLDGLVDAWKRGEAIAASATAGACAEGRR